MGSWTREPKAKASEPQLSLPEIPESARWAHKEQVNEEKNLVDLDTRLNQLFGGKNAGEVEEPDI